MSEVIKKTFKVRNMKDVDRYPKDDKKSRPYLNRLQRHILKHELSLEVKETLE